MPSHFPEASASNFTPAPTGNHRAVCFSVIDLGTQVEDYQGQTKRQRKVMLSWELADEMMEDDRPFIVSKFYTWSMNEKATLRKDLESWRGVPFTDSDLGHDGSFKPRNLLGAPCLVNIIHKERRNGGVGAAIASLARLPKGVDKPTARNATVFFDLDEFDAGVFEKLSDKMKEMIAKSPEYAEAVGRRKSAGGGARLPDDDIPFN